MILRKTESIMIQRMIRSVRARNLCSGEWPGKPLNAPATTLYPNILAEIDTSGMWLWCPAWNANVSPEVMAAVLEDGEELAPEELRALCPLFGRKEAYLAAASLQIIDPATNKGKARRQNLTDMLKQADGLDFPLRFIVEAVLFAMDRGKPVTYAEYRTAEDALQNALCEGHRTPRKKRRHPRCGPKAGAPLTSASYRQASRV